MIISFADKETLRVSAGERSRSLPSEIQKRARDRLRMIDAADHLEDLRSPPGNRLYALKENRIGQHSVSINDQWRICFVWKDGDAHDVEIIDYH